MEKDEQDFKYFINVKRTTLVISIQGMCLSEKVDVLQKCLEEATASPEVKFVILNLVALTGMQPGAVRTFAQFQLALRDGRELFVCSLNPEIEKILADAGVLRTSELVSDLLSALQMILQKG